MCIRDSDFLDLETPFLTRSTPEGARDFLVPSRVHTGRFYALPQSPQLFKQLFMIAGFDRYYQIVRCMRDEDLRADRQPEFTQLDMELAFVDEDDIRELIDRLLSRLFEELLGVEIELPIQQMEYQEAMARYGSDLPTRVLSSLFTTYRKKRALRISRFSARLSSPAVWSGASVFQEEPACRARISMAVRASPRASGPEASPG